MTRWTRLGAALLLGAIAACAGDGPRPDADARARILALGPWPMASVADRSNRVSGKAAAAAFGEHLFYSPRLSSQGALRCASCHEPWRAFSDGRPRGLGAGPGSRNTPSLLNVRDNRAFGWDGAHDSLWSQSLRPLLDPLEMASSPARIASVLRGDADFAREYTRAFGSPPPQDDLALTADVGKALAAFQETLVSAPTAFDRYRAALADDDAAEQAEYPPAARAGLLLFVGKAGCVACHGGPRFSDGGFHPSRIRSTLGDGRVDPGYAGSIAKRRADPFRRGGRFSDAPDDVPVDPPPAIVADGSFRTPSLREVARTAPYMHDGSVERLCDTLAPHTRDAPAVPTLTLQQRRELVAFLRSISAPTEAPLVAESNFDCR